MNAYKAKEFGWWADAISSIVTWTQLKQGWMMIEGFRRLINDKDLEGHLVELLLDRQRELRNDKINESVPVDTLS